MIDLEVGGLIIIRVLYSYYPLPDGPGSDYSLLRTTSDYGRNRAATVRERIINNYKILLKLIFLKRVNNF
ncbi:hypothetical protein DI137_06610 [Legionella pneumophila]|nr:hypothetical protein DI137_06610 [Legionella pneumophila]